MVFSSAIFLFLFLPVVLGLYFLSPRVARNTVLLIASLLFYLWGGGELILLLLLSITSNYVLGWLVWKASAGGRRWCVAASVVINLSILGYFKYANFFVDQMNNVLGSWGATPGPWTEVVLPIGISFYTFQSMSYVFDLARRVSKPLRNPLDFALYVALFPQLIAGPIVRYHEIEAQLRERRDSLDNLTAGASRFALGLAKKIIVADTVGQVADQAFALPPGQVTSATVWLGVVAYTIQIYFDFSAYSDMAIGLGRMFGFRFPENFRRPYSALSITDFWRRWHITLSNWFRDYLYIPLGGSRGSKARTGFNLVFVFLVTGLWHGANWTFVLWGLYHGAWLILERLTGRRFLEPGSQGPLWRILQRALTLLIVMFGWALFRARDLDQAWQFWGLMVMPDGKALAPAVFSLIGPWFMICLSIGVLSFFLPGEFRARAWLTHKDRQRRNLATAAVMFVFLPLALMLSLSGTFSPFLYFQF